MLPILRSVTRRSRKRSGMAHTMFRRIAGAAGVVTGGVLRFAGRSGDHAAFSVRLCIQAVISERNQPVLFADS